MLSSRTYVVAIMNSGAAAINTCESSQRSRNPPKRSELAGQPFSTDDAPGDPSTQHCPRTSSTVKGIKVGDPHSSKNVRVTRRCYVAIEIKDALVSADYSVDIDVDLFDGRLEVT